MSATAGRVLAVEVGLVGCGWRWLRGRRRRAGEFGYHRGLTPVLAVVAGLVVVEGAAAELLLALLLPGTVWPWVGLAVHLYGLFWIGTLGASFAVRPHRLDATALHVRDGVFAELVVPRAAIRSARTGSAPGAWGRSGLVLGQDGRARLTHSGPDVVLELDPAVPVRDRRRSEPIGLRSLVITADDPRGLVRALTGR